MMHQHGMAVKQQEWARYCAVVGQHTCRMYGVLQPMPHRWYVSYVIDRIIEHLEAL